jgi:hypothetical protein
MSSSCRRCSLGDKRVLCGRALRVLELSANTAKKVTKEMNDCCARDAPAVGIQAVLATTRQRLILEKNYSSGGSEVVDELLSGRR